MPTVREIPDQDACANCDHLRWGPDQGWDKCNIDGHGIDWAKKGNLICERHQRSTAEDPRRVKRTKSV